MGGLVFALLLAAATAMADEAPWVPVSGSPGGLSAIEITDGGNGFIGLSDRGTMVFGQITRTGSGQITAAEVTRTVPIGGDSEGLALSGDALFVSRERRAPYVQRYDLSGRAGPVQSDAGLPPLPGNAGIEALAIAGDGALWAFPERLIDGYFGVWRFDGARWSQVLAIMPDDRRLRPVGADFGPDGQLYILERGLVGLGFASRIRVISPDGTGLRTLLNFPLGTHGNLEGLSIWRDSAGHLRATMVEDDNQNAFQRGGMVEYILP